MEIVVNEWLLDYLLPSSTKEQREFVTQFIDIWKKRCDKVLIRNPSPFVKKFYRYWKSVENNQDYRKRFKILFDLFFVNLDKTRIVNDADVQPLSEVILQKVPRDDKYLVELVYTSTDRIIVTTDENLKEKLRDQKDLKIYLLGEFIEEFLSKLKKSH